VTLPLLIEVVEKISSLLDRVTRQADRLDRVISELEGRANELRESGSEANIRVDEDWIQAQVDNYLQRKDPSGPASP